jgi:hypothetical protein
LQCPFMDVRFNCLEQNTSASQFVWEPRAFANCEVPTVNQSIALLSGELGRKKKPRRVLMCGDSHMKQIYETLVCNLQERVERIKVGVRPPGIFKHFETTRWFERGHFPETCRGSDSNVHFFPANTLCAGGECRPGELDACNKSMREKKLTSLPARCPGYGECTLSSAVLTRGGKGCMHSDTIFDFGLEVRERTHVERHLYDSVGTMPNGTRIATCRRTKHRSGALTFEGCPKSPGRWSSSALMRSMKARY